MRKKKKPLQVISSALSEVQEDDVPTEEDNKTTEAGILDFLASIAEHSKEAPHDNGDVLSPIDFEMEFNGSPFRVIDEYYGGKRQGNLGSSLP